jgi:hypothetical protein
MDNGDATNADLVIAKKIAERAVTCKLEPSDTVRAYVEAGCQSARKGTPGSACKRNPLVGDGSRRQRSPLRS